MTKIINKNKARDDFEVCIGTVIEAPPTLKIKVLNEELTLEYPKHLYLNNRLRWDYKREFTIEGEITEEDMTVESSSMTKAGQGPHDHTLKSFKAKGKYKSTGTITNTDTLKVGDLVKLTPTANGQKWFVDYKVLKEE